MGISPLLTKLFDVSTKGIELALLDDEDARDDKLDEEDEARLEEDARLDEDATLMTELAAAELVLELVATELTELELTDEVAIGEALLLLPPPPHPFKITATKKSSAGNFSIFIKFAFGCMTELILKR